MDAKIGKHLNKPREEFLGGLSVMEAALRRPSSAPSASSPQYVDDIFCLFMRRLRFPDSFFRKQLKGCNLLTCGFIKHTHPHPLV